MGTLLIKRIVLCLCMVLALSGFKPPELPDHILYTTPSSDIYQWVKKLLPPEVTLHGVYVPTEFDISKNKPIKIYYIMYSVVEAAKGYNTLQSVNLASSWDLILYSFKGPLNPNSNLVLQSSKQSIIVDDNDPRLNRYTISYKQTYHALQGENLIQLNRFVGVSILSMNDLSHKKVIAVYQNLPGDQWGRVLTKELDAFHTQVLFLQTRMKMESNASPPKNKHYIELSLFLKYSSLYFYTMFIFLILRFVTGYRATLSNKRDIFHSGFTIINFIKLIFNPVGKITRWNYIEGLMYALMISAGLVILSTHLIEYISETEYVVFVILSFGALLFLPYFMVLLLMCWMIPCLMIKWMNSLGWIRSFEAVFLSLLIFYTFTMLASISYLNKPTIFAIWAFLILGPIVVLAIYPQRENINIESK